MELGVVEVLLVVLLVLGLLVVAALGSAAFLHWAIQRHNRVSPGTPTGAPLRWLCSPSTPARAHRRLRTAAATARSVPADPHGPSGSRAALAAELEARAVDLDRWVVWTSRAPARGRREHYRAIDAQLRQLEGLVMRLASLDERSPSATATTAQHTLDHVAERVAELEQAHAEIRAIEELALGTRPIPEPQRAPTPTEGRAARAIPPPSDVA